MSKVRGLFVMACGALLLVAAACTTPPPSAPERVVQVSTGWGHSCALTASGGVRCWGLNRNGRLGDGSEIDSQLEAVSVIGLSSGVASIDVGDSHSCAVLTSGALKCWGANDGGSLGDGTLTDRPVPVEVAGMSSGVADVAAGPWHSCAVMVGGGVKCWGKNQYNQLGTGTGVDSLVPVDVPGIADATAIFAGGSETCVIRAGGAQTCWGIDGPTENVALGGTATNSFVGYSHSCSTLSTGTIRCWGTNPYGQLGNGQTDPLSTGRSPVTASTLTSPASDVAGGYGHTCALLSGGGVQCWGNNNSGQLGNGSSVNSLTPVQVTGLSTGVQAVTGNGYRSCALLTSGSVRCWGEAAGLVPAQIGGLS